jgi:hypothetical protein
VVGGELTELAMMAAAVRTSRETSKPRRRVSMSGLMGSAYFDGTHNSPPSDTALSYGASSAIRFDRISAKQTAGQKCPKPFNLNSFL